MTGIENLANIFGIVFLRFHRLVDRRMTAEGASLAKTKVLLFLESHAGDARAADIAEYFGLAPRTVTEALDAMERDGLLRREIDQRDRRVKRLSLTDAGRAAVEATEPLRLTIIESIFGVLTGAERDQLTAILEKLTGAVDAQEAGKGE